MNNLVKNLQLNQVRTIKPENLDKLRQSDNIYKITAIIGSRANQINANIGGELKQKLREFVDSYSDNIDEYKENKEQAEMSRLYEMLPHPTLIALNEFKQGKLVCRQRTEIEEEPSTYLPESK